MERGSEEGESEIVGYDGGGRMAWPENEEEELGGQRIRRSERNQTTRRKGEGECDDGGGNVVEYGVEWLRGRKGIGTKGN